MIGFIRAHGYDPGPTQRPLLAGTVTGLLAAAPAAAVFLAFGSFQVAADEVLRLPRPWAAMATLAGLAAGGTGYGAFFRRAANDRGAGWILGMSYGFLLWVAAPIAVLPLLGGRVMAAGLPATGFFAAFLVWGLAAGMLFPFVHRPLQGGVDSERGDLARRFGPDAAKLEQRLLSRLTGRL